MKMLLSGVGLLWLCCVQTVNAQDFTLTQLITLHNLVDLPPINAYLEARGWYFSESAPGEEQDQVSWKHASASHKRPAVVNVFFCNSAINLYCDSPGIHGDGTHRQHAFLLLYQPSAKAFNALKKEVEAKDMALTSSVMENGIRYMYTGAKYMVEMNTTATDEHEGPRYYVELRRKTSLPRQ